MTALDEQIGGSHYKDFAIQPVEFIHKNKIGFIEGNIIKYICRYKSKGGIDDLKKVKHYAELLIELFNSHIIACCKCNHGAIALNCECKCHNPLKCNDCDYARGIGFLFCNKCKGVKR